MIIENSSSILPNTKLQTMKAFLIALLLPFGAFTTTNITSNEPTPDKSASEVEGADKLHYLNSIIHLGRKSKGCEGKGVCKIESIPSKPGPKIPNAIKAIATAKDGTVTQIEFLKSSMTKPVIDSWIRDSIFYVGESFRTQLTFDDKSYSFWIPKGKYPLKRTEKGFNIGMPPAVN